MVGELSFKNLPFLPEKGEVIYVEQTYHKRLNKFIRNNYEWLMDTFAQHQLHFCYLPLRAEEAVDYYAPYLTTEERRARIGHAPSLTDYMVGDADIMPSLVFALDTPDVKVPCDITLQSVTIDTKWLVSTKRTFARLAEQIEQVVTDYRLKAEMSAPKREEKESQQTRFATHKNWDPAILFGVDDSKKSGNTFDSKEKDSQQVQFSLHPSGEPTILFRVDDSEEADDNFDSESQKLIKEIRERLETLRNKGVNTMFLHDIIDKNEHLSRLRITKDYRIYLVDYHNMEIALPILPKAVFLLFLKHPEGIRFKELTDHYTELLQIYLKMRPIGGRKRQEQSVRDITDPRRNSINEKCARIREAFVRNFDDRLAKNYYITGKRGEAKRIVLDKSMIIWE